MSLKLNVIFQRKLSLKAVILGSSEDDLDNKTTKFTYREGGPGLFGRNDPL